jgi:hypothetical protein
VFSESQNEYVRDEKLYERFAIAIEASVRELIPVQQILQTYMTQENKDIDLGGEMEDTEDPEFVDEMAEPEPEPEPMQEPTMEGEGEGEESFPPQEEGPTDAEPEASPFDNEFKTIPTQDQPMQEQQAEEEEEEEPVLFPDASETRAKKVGYY